MRKMSGLVLVLAFGLAQGCGKDSDHDKDKKDAPRVSDEVKPNEKGEQTGPKKQQEDTKKKAEEKKPVDKKEPSKGDVKPESKTGGKDKSGDQADADKGEGYADYFDCMGKGEDARRCDELFGRRAALEQAKHEISSLDYFACLAEGKDSAECEGAHDGEQARSRARELLVSMCSSLALELPSKKGFTFSSNFTVDERTGQPACVCYYRADDAFGSRKLLFIDKVIASLPESLDRYTCEK